MMSSMVSSYVRSMPSCPRRQATYSSVSQSVSPAIAIAPPARAACHGSSTCGAISEPLTPARIAAFADVDRVVDPDALVDAERVAGGIREQRQRHGEVEGARIWTTPARQQAPGQRARANSAAV